MQEDVADDHIVTTMPPRKAQLPSLESYGDCGEPLKIELSEVLCSRSSCFLHFLVAQFAF